MNRQYRCPICQTMVTVPPTPVVPGAVTWPIMYCASHPDQEMENVTRENRDSSGGGQL